MSHAQIALGIEASASLFAAGASAQAGNRLGAIAALIALSLDLWGLLS